jgi:ATP-dependent protease Clp ATPase subunit
MIYYTGKNLCKCHNVLPSITTINKTTTKKKPNQNNKNRSTVNEPRSFKTGYPKYVLGEEKEKKKEEESRTLTGTFA